MKLKLLFLFLGLTQILSAQTFTEATGTPFDGVEDGSIAFSDVDGDGDPDVLITGRNSSWEQIAQLYTNDGDGNFTEMMGTPFDGVFRSSIAFSDVDGDGDPDVLITGAKDYNGNELIAKLYLNDGMGNFTELMGTPFEGVWRSSIAFADVDGDNDPDILITGVNSSDEVMSKLYINDGEGNFTEMMGTPFEGVYIGSIAFSDVDGDGDLDVLITGDNGTIWTSDLIAKLYINDGMGNFTEVTGTPFEGVLTGSVAFEDVDGDNDPDVLITGALDFPGVIANLYTNDGMGNFTENMGTPFDDAWSSSISFSDVDGDNDPDVLITGATHPTGADRIAKLYTNDGMGNFTEVTGTSFDGVYGSSIAFSDIDGDGDPDVLITGQNNSDEPIAKLYINETFVSIEDLNTGNPFDLTLFPNPSASSTLSMRFDSAEMGQVSISVYDVNGRLLKQQKKFLANGQQTISIDISSLSKGSYFLELKDAKRKEVAGFIVQ